MMKKKFTHYYKSIELEMIVNFLIYLLIKSLKLSIQQFKKQFNKLFNLFSWILYFGIK